MKRQGLMLALAAALCLSTAATAAADQPAPEMASGEPVVVAQLEQDQNGIYRSRNRAYNTGLSEANPGVSVIHQPPAEIRPHVEIMRPAEPPGMPVLPNMSVIPTLPGTEPDNSRTGTRGARR